MRIGTVIGLLLVLTALGALSALAHRFVTQERNYGRSVGTAYLQSQAELVAEQVRRSGRLAVSSVRSPLPIAAALVDAQGTVRDGNLPKGARCFGRVELGAAFPGVVVQVAWPGGADGLGARRMRRLRTFEISVLFAALAVLLAVAFWCLRVHLKTKRALAEQIRCACDFSHRLKTPITSISLCAELARSGRVPAEGRRACAETIVAEAIKLDAIVGEVLEHIEGVRHG